MFSNNDSERFTIGVSFTAQLFVTVRFQMSALVCFPVFFQVNS